MYRNSVYVNRNKNLTYFNKIIRIARRYKDRQKQNLRQIINGPLVIKQAYNYHYSFGLLHLRRLKICRYLKSKQSTLHFGHKAIKCVREHSQKTRKLRKCYMIKNTNNRRITKGDHTKLYIPVCWHIYVSFPRLSLHTPIQYLRLLFARHLILIYFWMLYWSAHGLHINRMWEYRLPWYKNLNGA